MHSCQEIDMTQEEATELLTLDVSGKAFSALNLDALVSPGEPYERLTYTSRRRGRGWSYRCTMPKADWALLLYDAEDRANPGSGWDNEPGEAEACTALAAKIRTATGWEVPGKTLLDWSALLPVSREVSA